MTSLGAAPCRRHATPAALAMALVAALSLASLAVPVAAAAPGEQGTCTPWTVRPVATGLTAVENLVDDGHGGLVLSMLEADELRRLTPDGATTVVAAGVDAPGGLARRGRWIYLTTGLTTESTVQGIPDGAIERLDLRTGRRRTWARGLVGPNGLALLRDGSAVTTRPLSTAGVLSEVTRVPAHDRDHPERFWSDLTSSNGAVVDRSGRWLYVSRSLSPRAEVWRIRTDDPSRRELVADLGVGSTEFLDDLTVAPDGAVYVAAWGSGKVYRVDPSAGSACVIAEGLAQASAVEPGGGHGFPRDRLYVSSHPGTVYELTPPG